jgi:pyrroline-5-carboxylate reductase
MPDNLKSLLAEDRILLVGGGKMGMALLQGWLATGLSPTQIAVQEPSPSDALMATNVTLNAQADFAPTLAILAVKPQLASEVLASLDLPAGALVISLMAGLPNAAIRRLLGDKVACVRTMPNTPASIGKGMTALFADAQVSSGERAKAEALLGAVGETVWVDSEKMMDAVTAVSGSGPAYLFHMVEALASSGVALGMSEAMAEQLARQTIIGAAHMLDMPQTEAAQLRRNVTSPGGTTEAALDTLMAAGGLSDLMRRATQSAANRARELAQLVTQDDD